MQKIVLNGTWEMQQEDDSTLYPAKIPGSVLSTLLEAEAIEDPYDRMNEYQTREMFWKDYSFKRSFEVEEVFLTQDMVELVCEGLDTLTDIFINEEKVYATNNMHRTWRIPVKEYLKVGKNEIKVVCRSPLQYMEDYEYGENKEVLYTPCGAMKGNHLIRKAHSMFGWDWGPQLVDAGIFRDIYLESWTGSRITDIRIHQEHQPGKVALQTEVQLTQTKRTSEGIEICLCLMEKETGKSVVEKHLKVPEESVICKTDIEVSNPRLWWPNGYGEQPLYELKVELTQGDSSIEEQHKTIGLRTLTVSREKDEWGREFAFMVNGQKIFTMGGNYIPEDCVYSHITEERQEYLLESMKRAHFNCVRVWGGGYYPSDTFYEICDRKGLIVWQDLMYACNVYDVTEEFAQNCRQEVIDNMKRLRHHASLGLICGNNEIESAWHHWGDFQKESLYLRADYIKLFEEILPKAVRETAPDTFYWVSSPSSGGCFDNPDDENNGDTHYWDVWHGQKPFTDYKKYFFRFCSEFGFQSFPSMKTVETFTREEDRNIFSRTMESHQKNDSANGKMLYYLSENFRYPAKFEDLLYVSQILQGVAIKYGVDHWRRHRGRCMGTLYWQVNDDWPAPSWSSIDYFGRWKALHYMACKFYAPTAASMTVENQGVQLFVENETKQEKNCQVEILVKNMKCGVIKKISGKGTVPAFASRQVLEMELAKIPEYAEAMKKAAKAGSWEEQVFIEGIVTLEDGTVLRNVETLLPYKYMSLRKPQIRTEVREEQDAYIIQLESDCFAPFVELDFADADVILEDNYFHLTNTESQEIRLQKADILKGTFCGADDVAKRLKIRTLADTYMNS